MQENTPEQSTKEDLNNELIDVLKRIQKKLISVEVQKFGEFEKNMSKQIDNEKIKLDNPKFNEFITKFTNDNNNMKIDEVQKISKKLRMAFFYINTD